jgi:hypothetical protein
MGVLDGRGRAWGPLSFAGLLVLAACASAGGGGTSTGGDGTASGGSVSSSEETRPPTPSRTDHSPDLTTTRFETPSKNIICESTPSSLTCVIRSGLVPEPSHDFCPVDWIGVFVQEGDYAGPSCSGDPGISLEPADVLPYGQTWALSGVRCISRSTGLTCRDGTGNGFVLARAGWSLLGKEAAATAMFPSLRSIVREQARSDLPGQVASVSAPVLRGGDGCGELQEGFVPLELADGRPALYTACFVSGTWYVTAGPLYPD